MITCN